VCHCVNFTFKYGCSHPRFRGACRLFYLNLRSGACCLFAVRWPTDCSVSILCEIINCVVAAMCLLAASAPTLTPAVCAACYPVWCVRVLYLFWVCRGRPIASNTRRTLRCAGAPRRAHLVCHSASQRATAKPNPRYNGMAERASTSGPGRPPCQDGRVRIFYKALFVAATAYCRF